MRVVSNIGMQSVMAGIAVQMNQKRGNLLRRHFATVKRTLKERLLAVFAPVHPQGKTGQHTAELPTNKLRTRHRAHVVG